MYTQVTASQIQNLIDSQTFAQLKAIKNKNVKAVQLTAEVVEKILAEGGYQTVVLDDAGQALLETTNKKIAANDWLVTNMLAGYDNSYVVGAAKFPTLYEATAEEGVYAPISGERTVYRVAENIEFEAPWGGAMKIRSGGVVVPDGDKFYGINPEEFESTYSVV